MVPGWPPEARRWPRLAAPRRCLPPLRRRNGDAELVGDFDVSLDLREHGEAASDVKAADPHLDTVGAEATRQVERPGELVRLHADKPDKAKAAIAGDAFDDIARPHPGVGFIDCRDVDGKVWSEHLASRRAEGETIDGGERIRRHSRAEPLHDVAVGVVMRWLIAGHVYSIARG